MLVTPVTTKHNITRMTYNVPYIDGTDIGRVASIKCVDLRGDDPVYLLSFEHNGRTKWAWAEQLVFPTVAAEVLYGRV